MVHNEYNEQAALINPDRKIEVYRNLHKDCWSVRQGGLVKFHCHEVNMRDCDFIVQPAGHARVLKEKKKNVHAFVRGYVTNGNTGKPRHLFTWDDIYYNPYKASTFIDFEDKAVVHADFVDMSIRDKLTPVLALNPT